MLTIDCVDNDYENNSGKKLTCPAHQTREQGHGLVESPRKSSATRLVSSVSVLCINNIIFFSYLKLFIRRWHFCIQFSFAPSLLRPIVLTTTVLFKLYRHNHYALCFFSFDRNKRLCVSALIRTLSVGEILFSLDSAATSYYLFCPIVI